jgi:RNA binding activity-knot of a chromodomain
MKRNLILMLAVVFAVIKTHAQPTKAQVVKRLTHAGVIKADVYKIEKIWHKTKYIWEAQATITKKVDPAKVDGLTGVTLVYNAIADYDLGASEPYWVGGSESNGEYEGINLPIPSVEELQKFATDAAKQNPEKFFMQAYTIVAAEKIELTKPNAKWLHPRKLQFDGTLFYVDKLTSETFQMLKCPVTMELHRDGFNAPWYLGKADARRMEQSYVGDIIHAADAPQWVGLPSISDRKADAAQKSKALSIGVGTAPVFSTAKELALHLNEKFHTYTKEQMQAYLPLLLHSSLRQPGTTASPNGNAQQMIETILDKAYAGWGKFKDQYCLVPSKDEYFGDLQYSWYNKKNDRYTRLSFKKENGTFTIEQLDLGVEKKKETSELFLSIECSGVIAASAAGESAPIAGGAAENEFKKGEKVMVKESFKWYPATVLDIRPGEWFIHYDGYDAKYDLWVKKDKIKKR